MTARFIVGDVFDVLATLPDDSVDLVMSSPPFLALRSYLPADHPDKHKEIGSEATPADFLDTLLDVVEACDRVLAPHGSLCFELGDTFAGGGQGPDAKYAAKADQVLYNPTKRRMHSGPGGLANYSDKRGNPDGMRDTTFQGANTRSGGGNGWPLDKSLCLIPTLFAASLAYGYNMLRPERSTPRWRVRNLVVWARPNPPVGALGDKFRPATSYLTVACKSRTRYFDLDAVRTPAKYDDDRPVDMEKRRHVVGENGNGHMQRVIASNVAGAPPLDYWVIPTHPYPGSHYATFPPELCVKPIAAMSPLRVCRVCGEPSRRIVERTEEYAAARAAIGDFNQRDEGQGSRSVLSAAAGRDMTCAENVTVGWSDCGHDATCTDPIHSVPGADCRACGNTGYVDHWRPGHVLDPFAGSGTIGAVATGHGRDATLIDLDARNADLAVERVGPMFLTVEHLSSEGVA